MPPKKFEDVGMVIPNARKHLMGDQQTPSSTPHKPIIQENEGLQLKQLWPKPDVQVLLSNGHSLQSALNVILIYNNLKTKPRKIRNKPQAVLDIAYKQSINYLIKLTERPSLFEDLKQVNSLFCDRFLVYQNEEISLEESLPAFVACKSSGSRIYPATRLSGKTKEIAKVAIELGWPEIPQVLKISKVPMKFDDGSWGLVKVNQKSYTWNNSEVFETKEEAIDNLKQSEGLFPKPKSKPKVYKPSKSPIELQDHHIQRTPEELIETFAFRGLQFGNWLSGADRRIWVNNIYQAFLDLAQFLNIPPKWIGLGGLGLAFGARGSSKANAHFESSLYTINLTKLNGPGWVAHEWFHAADYRFGKSLGRNKLASEVIDHVSASSPKIDAMIILKREIYQSTFYKNALRLDQQTNKKEVYWSSPEELFARLFESYVQDQLLSKEIDSPWLASGTLPKDHQAHPDMHPYPVGNSRIILNELMNNFIQTLFTK